MNSPSENSPFSKGYPEGTGYLQPPLSQKGNIQITLNGEKTEIAAGTSLQKLLEDLKLKPQLVAVELNEKIIRRAAYSMTTLSEGDQIEILQMIGGG